MAGRQKYQFSIISYNQNSMRNEAINIGALLYSEQERSARFKIIPHNSIKIRGLALTPYQKDLFQTTIKYLRFVLTSLDSDFSTQMLDSTIENDLPEQIRFSNPKPIVTAKEDLLFQQIVAEYVGDEYFKQNDEVTSLTPKEQVIQLFKQHKLLGNKIRKNVKIRPAKSVEMRFNIDFAYGEKTSLNLIDSSPIKESALDDWYVKMVMLSSRYDKDSSIILINDSQSSINNDKKVSQMISDLLKGDSRIQSMDISKMSNLKALIDKISSTSVDSQQLDKLISRNNLMIS